MWSCFDDLFNSLWWRKAVGSDHQCYSCLTRAAWTLLPFAPTLQPQASDSLRPAACVLKTLVRIIRSILQGSDPTASSPQSTTDSLQPAAYSPSILQPKAESLYSEDYNLRPSSSLYPKDYSQNSTARGFAASRTGASMRSINQLSRPRSHSTPASTHRASSSAFLPPVAAED